MKRLQVTDFGPIHQADVTFGDLTVLVGQQATGKSLFAQLYKLVQDPSVVAEQLERYGFDWTNGTDLVAALCSHYFGDGLGRIWTSSAQVIGDGRSIDPTEFAKPINGQSIETTFLIPAQRSLVLHDGWPKSFTAFNAGDSFKTRHFSECIRAFMERTPDRALLDRFAGPEVRSSIENSVYADSMLELERVGTGRRVVLKPRGSLSVLPYRAWSRGQQEFTPILLGLAAFASKTTGEHETTVILEKPEMGLHPEAVLSVGLLVLELLARNYRVIVSTHSPIVLDLVWAIRELSSVDAELGIAALCRIFNVDKPSAGIRDILAAALRKDYRTYLFKRSDTGVVTEDISVLDPGAENEDVAGWGGLSGVSGRIARIVGGYK